MLELFTRMTRRATAEREAAAIQRATDAELRAARAEGALLNVVEDLELVPASVALPAQLQGSLAKARTLLGGDHGG